MLRTFAIFMGLVMLFGFGVAAATWPRNLDAPMATQTIGQLRLAYAKVRPGVTPVSGLAALGFNPAAARTLSYFGAVEQFAPKDSYAFDTLDPAVQACLGAPDRCLAYVFQAAGTREQVTLLVQGGRVVSKDMAGVVASGHPAMLRAAMN
jgi:hypothetical protein